MLYQLYIYLTFAFMWTRSVRVGLQCCLVRFRKSRLNWLALLLYFVFILEQFLVWNILEFLVELIAWKDLSAVLSGIPNRTYSDVL